MSEPREARLELAATLRHPLPMPDAEALVALLGGRAARRAPPHPLFRHPDLTTLLAGESLDHATRGSRIVQDEAGAARLEASASLPPCPALLSGGLDWLGSLLALRPGDVPGFIVPPGMGRHDLRLLVWDGSRLRPLASLPDDASSPRCSLDSFMRAAGLPPMAEGPAAQRAVLRRVALAQLQGRCLPVAQRQLDGPYRDRQGMFRLWMTQALLRLEGLSTAAAPMMVRMG
jgi:hypothetical protein